MKQQVLALVTALSLTVALNGTRLAAAGDPSQWGRSASSLQGQTAGASAMENEYEGQHR
jgi:hypothetical protein